MEVPGLQLYHNFFDQTLEEKLIKEIDAQIWLVDYSRRLQYYGFRNELEAPYGLVTFPVPIPPIMYKFSQTLVSKKILLQQPDQVIVNEYSPGQGIRPHKDRNYFENQICGVNLGSGCIMRFIRDKTKEVVDVEFPRFSIYVMQDEARKNWQHAIPPRKKDLVDGEIKLRDRRLSITYRKVKERQVHPIDPNGKVAQVLREKFNVSS